MFQKDEDIYPFKFSLKATINFLEKYIIQNHSDFIGILFFSTVSYLEFCFLFYMNYSLMLII